MAEFGLDDQGGTDDRVRIQLGEQEIRIVETYEVSHRLMTQPAAFAVRIGNGEITREFMRCFPPNTPFRLHIGSVLQQSGRTDGFAPGDVGGATQLSLPGRDSLAPLHDAHALADESFGSATYKDLVVRCLEGAGIRGYSLNFSNEATRRARAGVPVKQTKAPRKVEGARIGVTVVSAPTGDGLPTAETTARLQAALDAQAKVAENDAIIAGTSGGPATAKALQIKVGQTWYAFLKTELERAGLFFFCGVAENNFILTEPNTNQLPTYRIVRQRDAPINAVNAISAQYRNITTGRHSHYVVYGRGGGGAAGRTKTRGSFTDDEMVAWGYDKPWSVVDSDVKSLAQANQLARRKCAEERRAGWELIYTVRGHTAPSRVGGGRAIWTPDTVVEVLDEEYGIRGRFWIEGVTYRGGPQGRTTELSLMRPDDLVFGDGVSND